MPYRKTKWTDDELGKLGLGLKTAVEALPKPKKERYLDFDEKTRKWKYKFREVEIKEVECPECGASFFKKRPKQIFCQDFCRIRNWQKLKKNELRNEQSKRIRKMWG
jgi:hypothetical protein